MPRRRTLPEQAERLADVVRAGSITGLPAEVLREIDQLSMDLGLSKSIMDYAPRTRRRFLSAARQGRNAREERERERLYRAQRDRQRRGESGAIESDPRWQEIVEIANYLLDAGMVPTSGPLTQTDELDHENLLSSESLYEHVRIYGFEYVLRRIRHMKDAVDEYDRSGGLSRSLGRKRMQQRFGTTLQRDLKASSPEVFRRDDERWYWYHTGHPGTGTHLVVGE